MEIDYFDFGIYKIRLKQNSPADKGYYTVTKNNQSLLDSLSLKFYNQKTLIAFDNGSLTFYDLNLKPDSQFHYRTMSKGWVELEFLIDNKIKHISTENFIAAFPDENERAFGCGNVTHYTLKIGKTISEIINGEMSGESSYTRNIAIQFPVQNDSMLFINQQREMSWSDNGGFNDKILLFKKGKVGLSEFDLQDSLMALKQILPIEFDKIYLINGNIILNKNRQEDFYTYYIKNKKMRFNKISYENSTYLRYQKIDNTKGWINSKGILFDDE
jgi:hypothetical protein